MNGECCGSREEGQANDIPATLVVVYYSSLVCLSLESQPESQPQNPKFRINPKNFHP